MKNYPYRMVEAEWNKEADFAIFPARIKIIAEDNREVMNAITELLSVQLKLKLKSVSFENVKREMRGTIDLIVKDLTHLEKIMAKINKLKGIKKVSRK